MDGQQDGRGASTGTERSNGSSGRLSWPKRPGHGHNRAWARISLGAIAGGRRRDRETKSSTPRSPPSRRISMGGAMREEGVGAGGAAYHGRHGIRYEHSHSDTWLEELKQEENVSDLCEDQAMSMPTSSSMGQLVGSRRGGEQHETIAEEDGGALSTDGEEETRDADEERESNSTHGHRRDNATRGIHLMTLHIDKVPESALGVTGQVSPASERAGRPSASGSVSPGRLVDNRQRTHSWAPALSPPVLFGPFSKTRSRSRSPRGRMSMVGPSLDGIPRLHGNDLGRLSTGGGDRAPALSKEASVSTAEEYLGWSEGEGGTAAGEEQHQNTSSFADSALVMARLRLPNMELGFEEDGFFGIDVRSLIIGQEIARGAYGVVHEGVLLEQKLEEGGPDDDQSGAARKSTGGTGETEGGGSLRSGDEARATETGAEESENGAANQSAKIEGVDREKGSRGVGEAGKNTADEGIERRKSGGTSVAVKIQQVPVDEEEQANLLGELGMLRNYAHPHLVEFIGTAMAMERGADTVMVAMELCTNGALREALKLNISWPLKVRIGLDMTDGLHYLHSNGIIHRDIKTPNVLIDSSWRAKLCDYNFAIDEDSSIKQEFCAGTAEFMSPEVLLSEEYGLPSDLFSLGMIFVEMLTGKEPSSTFPERPPQTFFVVAEEEIQRELLPECPSSFSLLQSQCLFAEPAERPTAEDAHGWLQDLMTEMGEQNITLPQSGPPLPVLTEGAAIAREGNVINASPKGTEHHWFDSDAMEHQIGSMVDNAVDRALAERGQHLGLSGPADNGAADEENVARLDGMKEEMEALRAACEERDSRISDLEVQALRNTSTLKMLSSALEVAYKMLETQQASLSQPNSNASLESGAQDDGTADLDGVAGKENEDFDTVEARISHVSSDS